MLPQTQGARIVYTRVLRPAIYGTPKGAAPAHIAAENIAATAPSAASTGISTGLGTSALGSTGGYVTASGSAAPSVPPRAPGNAPSASAPSNFVGGFDPSQIQSTLGSHGIDASKVQSAISTGGQLDPSKIQSTLQGVDLSQVPAELRPAAEAAAHGQIPGFGGSGNPF